MHIQLNIIDYLFFGATMFITAIIGVYFGCFGSKQKSAKEYMYGKKALKALPVGLSIYSSSVSAVSILGTPSEIYIFGIQYSIGCIGSILSLIIVYIFVIPVFNSNLKVATPYEYYEHRFNKPVRLLSSCLFLINACILCPIALYSSCIPFSEATGVHVAICTSIFGAICIIYTMLGGFSAVIWTDTLQAFLIFFSLICIMVSSILRANGFYNIWNSSKIGERLNVSFDPNPFVRLSFWSMTVGYMFNIAGYYGSQAITLQRYMSLRTENDAKKSIFIGVFGYAISLIISGITGLAMYTVYKSCDPVGNKMFPNHQQMTASYALETVGNIPGISGIYVAGILSAGLSTLSAKLNTLSGIVYYDFIQSRYNRFSSDAKGAIIMKCIVFIFGVYVLIMAPYMQKIKFLTQITLTLLGTILGVQLGLIISGTALPKINATGALCGAITSFVIVSWIAIGATSYDMGSKYKLPISTENCTYTNNNIAYFNSTTILSDETYSSKPLYIYNLSFAYYTLVACIITLLIANIVSYTTGGNKKLNLDPNYFIPWVRSKSKPNQDEMEAMLKINNTNTPLKK